MERDKIFLVGRDRGELIPMEAADYTSEDELQAYLARYPDLLAGHQINPDPPRWVSAVNNWGRLGTWDFHVNKAPQMLERELAHLVNR